VTRPFGAARLEEIERLRTRHGYDWHSIRHHFDIRGFGVNANVAVEPGLIVEEHDEMHPDGDQEELYVVVSGHATFTIDGQAVDAPTGTLVFVRDAAVVRAAMAHETGTTLLCVGGRREKPFRISSWEYTRRAQAAGDPEAGVRIIEELVAERPDDARGLYDLACFESLAGRREEALDHLRRALELDPTAAELARDDEDFDPIRDDPRFPLS
jgi:quercetin dioxygenase-like cupin family protein